MTEEGDMKVKRKSWHDEARALRAEGWTFAKIAEKVGVTAAAVYFVIYPDKRRAYAKKQGAKVLPSAPLPETA